VETYRKYCTEEARSLMNDHHLLKNKKLKLCGETKQPSVEKKVQIVEKS
jgi:hypothetical protein